MPEFDRRGCISSPLPTTTTTTHPTTSTARTPTFAHADAESDLIGAGAAFRRLIEEDRVPSVIFWGPPGCGKTTICEIISRHSRRKSVKLSAVTSGVADIRKAVEDATGIKRLLNKGTLLFVDEIHRWSKSQQDALLPHVESGYSRLWLCSFTLQMKSRPTDWALRKLLSRPGHALAFTGPVVIAC